MKNWYFICLSLLFLCACDSHKGTTNNVSSTIVDSITHSGFVSKAGWFDQKKREMMGMPDNEYYFRFSDDTELQELDPHAFWLMNRMMQMMQSIKTADDGWAWLLAMNESVDMYNARLGRKIGGPELAMQGVDNLIDKYCAGTQPQMNTASYVYMIIEHYKTLCNYHDLIGYFDEPFFDEDAEKYKSMQDLIYQEYTAWFDLNNAVNAIMTFYTYGAAGYSAAPMDINSYFEYWSKTRSKELEVEKNICLGGLDKPFKSTTKVVSADKFNELVNYFKTRTWQTVIDEYQKDWDEKDFEFAKERMGGQYNFARIDEVTEMYIEALERWSIARKQVSQALPEKDGADYDRLTAQMHTRFYEDLLELKELKY